MAYFPNGSSGEKLEQQCADCPLGYGWNDPKQGTLFDPEPEPRPCPVASVQLQYNYDQIRGRGCDETADYLESLKGDNVPSFDEGHKDGNVTVSYGSSEQQLETAVDWLRSDQFRDAMNQLINEDGACQVREQLVQIRREQR